MPNWKKERHRKKMEGVKKKEEIIEDIYIYIESTEPRLCIPIYDYSGLYQQLPPWERFSQSLYTAVCNRLGNIGDMTSVVVFSFPSPSSLH